MYVTYLCKLFCPFVLLTRRNTQQFKNQLILLFNASQDWYYYFQYFSSLAERVVTSLRHLHLIYMWETSFFVQSIWKNCNIAKNVPKNGLYSNGCIAVVADKPSYCLYCVLYKNISGISNNLKVYVKQNSKNENRSSFAE